MHICEAQKLFECHILSLSWLVLRCRDEEEGLLSKHRLQQSGKSHSISGFSPPQSDHKSSRIKLVLRLQTVLGMVPVIWLSCSRNSLSLCRSPDRIDGTVPVNWFPSRYRSRKMGGFRYCIGMRPDKAQLDMYTSRMVGIEKIDWGIPPLRRLLETSKKSKIS